MSDWLAFADRLHIMVGLRRPTNQLPVRHTYYTCTLISCKYIAALSYSAFRRIFCSQGARLTFCVQLGQRLFTSSNSPLTECDTSIYFLVAHLNFLAPTDLDRRLCSRGK